MATEIERKFLVDSDALPAVLQTAGEGVRLVQGYIQTNGHTVVRLRRAGASAFLTIKGPGSKDGTTRAEFEYPVPVDDAEAMLATLCGPSVEKTRYGIQLAAHLWELDVFDGRNTGLVLAEVELQHKDEAVELPAWIDREVTGEAAYYNSELAKNPYADWTNS